MCSEFMQTTVASKAKQGIRLFTNLQQSLDDVVDIQLDLLLASSRHGCNAPLFNEDLVSG